jgi:RHS repeat-associated protein
MARDAATATYQLVKDHLGSVRYVVDTTTGVVAQELDYDAWGRVLVDTNPGLQPFGFAGGLYDADTGLVRFGAREYSPEIGRWTAKDPIGFDGGDTNIYAYVGNDPVNRGDATGLSAVYTGCNACVARCIVGGVVCLLRGRGQGYCEFVQEACEDECGATACKDGWTPEPPEPEPGPYDEPEICPKPELWGDPVPPDPPAPRPDCPGCL